MVKRLQAITTRMYSSASMLGIGASFIPQTSLGLTFVLPANGNIVGHLQYAPVHPGDSVATLARRYDMGGYEMLEANPGINYDHPSIGENLIVPSSFILPDAPRDGIVINLAEMRLYYYHPDHVHVSTYPVGVGKAGWNTPLGKTQVVRKREHPTWVVPDSILANHIEHGQPIEKTRPPGPDNPLGDYAMNLGFANIVIHGTNTPKAVGVRASHGCIRMLPEDVKALFQHVRIGTPVYIIHQPTKIGRKNNQLYLEAHVPLGAELHQTEYSDVGNLIHKVKPAGSSYHLEWEKIHRLQQSANGYPLPIGNID